MPLQFGTGLPYIQIQVESLVEFNLVVAQAGRQTAKFNSMPISGYTVCITIHVDYRATYIYVSSSIISGITTRKFLHAAKFHTFHR